LYPCQYVHQCTLAYILSQYGTFTLDSNNWKLTPLIDSGRPDFNRRSHVILENDKLYVMGGHEEKEHAEFPKYMRIFTIKSIFLYLPWKTVYVLDLKTKEWSKITDEIGNSFVPNLFSSYSKANNKHFFLGGRDKYLAPRDYLTEVHL